MRFEAFDDLFGADAVAADVGGDAEELESTGHVGEEGGAHDRVVAVAVLLLQGMGGGCVEKEKR